ncbi:MAG TPA: bifunctional UDP-N-acetylglucosamine diphosphorylase/glucosamine-1-phosphate N-acetyltransferase GlmU, partial [Bryobacteraceae bacterium]|nr:bifunctional UDP-N-acetylglucosamine diphosphorylase/glucosamine-1-phosphate N-acetyltransferase GlmU [Bryobacteraceae bacterium]
MNDKLTVVILAAGLGTRMKSRKAKVLHEAGGLPLVEHVVLSALALAPADRVVVVVGHQAEQVEAQLSHYNVRFVRQTDQRGTGHALSVCRDAVPDHEGQLVVLYGDCPLLQQSTLETLLQTHAAQRVAATVITTELDDPTGYGRMIVDQNRNVQAIVEHKVATPEQRAVREINSGIYSFEAPLLWKHLPEIEPNPISGEYYLTDIVEILNRAGHRVHALLHRDASELLGINTRVELAEVDRIFRQRKVRELMLEGVTIQRPETVTIDRSVRIGMDTIIEPFVRILGSTHVGENCRIGAGAILEDAEIADQVDIAPYTIVRTSSIGERASIGPFARLRQNNMVGAGAHIGNFVELKNTHFGEGVKAGHLAYLGDAEIGPGTNVGAGTITCNYDGVKKHKTKVGSSAFLGSNSTLVAPISIGDGAYVGAASVVTDDVPADALALGRARQVVKEGWA